MLNKCDRIIYLVRKRNPRYLKKTHKFGIEVPTTMAEAHKLEKKNVDTHWADMIASEMNNLRFAFDVLPDGQNAPIGNQFVKCHMIFDLNMEDFRRKTQYVAGGHIDKCSSNDHLCQHCLR